MSQSMKEMGDALPMQTTNGTQDACRRNNNLQDVVRWSRQLGVSKEEDHYACE
jgi:hypothetical protein